MQLFDLTGKVAIVTGTTKGIGRAIAETLCEQGACVVVCSRSEADCDATAEELCRRHGENRAFAVAADIAEPASIERLVERVLAHYDTIDILVCNAALMGEGKSPDVVPGDEFMEQYRVNVEMTLRLVQLVAPAMVRQRSGSIILIGSRVGLAPAPQQVAYSCAKAAMTHLATNLAAHYAPRGVRVNCVSPGLIRTDAAREIWEKPDLLDSYVADVPLGRMGEPCEIAGAVAFFASPASSYIAGAVLAVDGGVVSLPFSPGRLFNQPT